MNNSTIVVVPSAAVESQLGGLAGQTALSTGLERDKRTWESTSVKPVWRF
jgi:hypothetical protein